MVNEAQEPGRVVVVGGGPVGMLLAAELAGQGVLTVVLESETATSQRPRATTLHARTVQCLARRGYHFGTGGDPGSLAGLAAPAPGGPAKDPRTVEAPFHFGGIPGLRLTAPAGEPAPLVKRSQAEVEQLFEARARARGACVLRGHRAVRIDELPGGVRVLAEGPDGPRAFTGEFVVGADGARGVVREQARIGADTSEATVSALMGLVRLEEPGALPTGWHRTERGWVVAKNDPGGETHVRVVTGLDRGRGRRHLPLTLEELRAETSWVAGRWVAMSSGRWLSRFSDYTRLARAYRSGRIFLAGDAAHVHFPVGGQGLSTGLLDALNLSWKLALAVRGAAGDGLLDSYDRERRPAAQRVVDNTRAQVALMRPDPELDALRALFGDLLARGRDNDRLSGLISAQDTVLPARGERPSRGEGTFLSNVPLRTDEGPTDVVELLARYGFVLLLVGDEGRAAGEQARGWEHVVRVVRVLAGSELPSTALLVRPDGYIAWASGGESLASALAGYFGTARRSTSAA